MQFDIDDRFTVYIEHDPLMEEKQFSPFDDYPRDLAWLLFNMDHEITILMSDLENGEITPEEWEGAMMALLGRYTVSSYMTGAGLALFAGITAVALASLQEWLARQIGYLKRFGDVIRKTIAGLFLDSDGNPIRIPWKSWFARARSYRNSIAAPYWKGIAMGLPLPAYPGDGSSLCGQNCRCRWEIQVLDREKGDFDCYWKEGIAEHCQTCIERANSWNPIRVRDWRLILPDVQHSQGPQIKEVKMNGNYRVDREQLEKAISESLKSRRAEKVRQAKESEMMKKREGWFIRAVSRIKGLFK